MLRNRSAPGRPGVQVVVLVQLVVYLLLFHRAHEPDAVGVRLPRAVLTNVGDSRRNVVL